MSTETRTSAFDVRLIIAALTGIYGLVITVLGIGFTTDADLEKSAGVNINLWAGIGMLVISALFVLWVRLSPLRVPVDHSEETAETPPH
jgi:hypothetical protein